MPCDEVLIYFPIEFYGQIKVGLSGFHYQNKILGVLDITFSTSTWANNNITVPNGGQKLFDITGNQVKIFAFMYQGRKGVYSCNSDEGSVTAIVPALYVEPNTGSGSYILRIRDHACYFEAVGQIIGWKIIWEKP